MGVVISYPGIANQSFVCMIASGAELPKDSCILFLSAEDTFWSGIQLSSLVLVISDPTLPYSWDSRSFTCISNYIKKNFNLIIKHYPDFLLAILFGNAIQWKTLCYQESCLYNCLSFKTKIFELYFTWHAKINLSRLKH